MNQSGSALLGALLLMGGAGYFMGTPIIEEAPAQRTFYIPKDLENMSVIISQLEPGDKIILVEPSITPASYQPVVLEPAVQDTTQPSIPAPVIKPETETQKAIREARDKLLKQLKEDNLIPKSQ